MTPDGTGRSSVRRRALAGVIAAGVLLVACGGDSDAGDDDGGSGSRSGDSGSPASGTEVGFQGMDGYDTSGIEVLPIPDDCTVSLAAIYPGPPGRSTSSTSSPPCSTDARS